MKEHLIELEKRAIALMNSAQPTEAAAIFEKIIQEQPDWEHGYGLFNLAGCYEDAGQLEKARINYERAVKLNPNDSLLLGAHASFLYLHGEPADAFDAYLRLLAFDAAQNDSAGLAKTVVVLHRLGQRLGLSSEAVERRITQAFPTFKPKVD